MDDRDLGPLDYQSTHAQGAQGKPSNHTVIVLIVHLLLFSSCVVLREASDTSFSLIKFILCGFFWPFVLTLPVVLVVEVVQFIIRPRVSFFLLMLGHGGCVLYTIWNAVEAHGY